MRENNPEIFRERQRQYALKSNYGITQEDYQKMVIEQKGLCAICEQVPSEWPGRTFTLVVDHDHNSGKVRGLLCNQCNRVLGLFDENPDRFIEAAMYLLKFKEDDE